MRVLEQREGQEDGWSAVAPRTNGCCADEREADEMVECAHCRRTFLPERLEIHLRSCRPGRAARPVGSLRSSAAARASGGQEHGGVSAAPRSIAALGAAAARLPPASPSPTSGPGWAERERALAPQPRLRVARRLP